MKIFPRKVGIPYSELKGQSFVELALILPIILVLLAGMVEVASFIFTYLNLLDLTREAARFASIRDWRSEEIDPTPYPPILPFEEWACVDESLDFYYDTACFFTDQDLNRFTRLDPNNFDDVYISVVTISNGTVSDRRDWALYGDNWSKDCEGNTILNEPFFTNAELKPDTSVDRGLVIVEVYYCYDQILQLPIISDIVPNPARIHTYTIMPAPEAIPTPTPIP
jgi:hypothetical protein